jgi:hypothetical protein
MRNIVNLYNRSDLLHNDAGTYFHNGYEDSERIYTLFDSLCWANQLLRDEAYDASRLFYRNEIPPLHRDLFRSIVVNEREYRDGRKQILLYGNNPVIRYGDDYCYGVPASAITGAVALPDRVIDVDICCDLPIDPTIVLLKNEHFVVHNGYLIFTQDLFDLLPSNGDVPNRTLTLWLRSVYSDRHYLQDRLGVLTGTRGQSTHQYRDLCNMVLNIIMGGTTKQHITKLMCWLFDVPCTDKDEVIKNFGSDNAGRWLATDYHIYRAPSNAKFLYTEGKLPAGTVLTDAILPIFGDAFPDGEPLLIDKRFLDKSYISGLTFPNELLPLTYDKGHRPVFDVVGRHEDIARFWDSIYSHVEDKLFLVKSAVGGKINPAKFIYENVYYPSVLFFRVYIDKTGKNKLPTENTSILRSLLVPGVLFDILLIDKPYRAELEFGFRARITQNVGTPRVSVTLPEWTFRCN